MTAPPIRYEQFARRAPDGDFDVASLFDAGAPAGPLELEVGFGRGRFLLERARAAPESRILGIEIKAKWGHLVEQRRIREGLTNAVALAGDARENLTRARPDGCLERAFIHFPDPWWKKRHAKRRVVDDDFLVQLARLLRTGGELFIQTDVEDRAQQMRDYVAGSPAFEIVPCEVNSYGARSNREVRAEEDGLPVYRVLAIRR